MGLCPLFGRCYQAGLVIQHGNVIEGLGARHLRIGGGPIHRSSALPAIFPAARGRGGARIGPSPITLLGRLWANNGSQPP
jgi:hypothetical protein